MHRTPVALVPEDDLETALRLCEMNHEEPMPAVDNGEDMRVIGEVRYQDLALAYNGRCSPPAPPSAAKASMRSAERDLHRQGFSTCDFAPSHPECGKEH